MDRYTRRQLTLLLVVVLVAGAGLAVDRWRRAHPDIADRLESLDRTPTPPPAARAGPRPSRASTPVPVDGAALLDPNHATPAELERLPGIGPGLAMRIVTARDQGGAFGSVDDLRRVRGIGRATLERVRPLLAVRPSP